MLGVVCGADCCKVKSWEDNGVGYYNPRGDGPLYHGGTTEYGG